MGNILGYPNWQYCPYSIQSIAKPNTVLLSFPLSLILCHTAIQCIKQFDWSKGFNTLAFDKYKHNMNAQTLLKMVTALIGK